MHYSGAKSRPWYGCTQAASTYAERVCQRTAAAVIDELVAEQILEPVAPAALEASLAPVAGVEREREALAKQWQLRRERARYETERAARQYQACEPENRLVARELERRWEEALEQQGQLEEEHDRWQRSAPSHLSGEDEQAIRSLATDLPALWQAETTTQANRQRIARLLLERVIVTVDKTSEKVDVQLHWMGGLVRSHVVSRPVIGVTIAGLITCNWLSGCGPCLVRGCTRVRLRSSSTRRVSGRREWRSDSRPESYCGYWPAWGCRGAVAMEG